MEKPFVRPIPIDLFCLRCGYNLRTCPVIGVCPECGLKIRASLLRIQIARLDPDCMAKLRSGTTWMCRAVFGALAAFGICQVVLWVLSIWISVPSHIAFFALLVGLFIALAAVWMFTASPAVAGLGRSAELARNFAHWLTLPVAAGSLWLTWAIATGPPSSLDLWIGALATPFGLLGGIGAIAFAYYCRALAGLVHGELAMRSADQYLCCFAVVWPFCFAGMLMGLLGQSADAAFCAAVPGGIGALAFGTLILALPTYFDLEAAAGDERTLFEEMDPRQGG